MQHIPHPSVTAFERFLGNILAQRPCDGCRKSLGSAPRRMLNHKQFHPECDAKIERYVRMLEGKA